jgi:hypothetical protein
LLKSKGRVKVGPAFFASMPTYSSLGQSAWSFALCYEANLLKALIFCDIRIISLLGFWNLPFLILAKKSTLPPSSPVDALFADVHILLMPGQQRLTLYRREALVS